jgi:hypothetical protein
MYDRAVVLCALGGVSGRMNGSQGDFRGIQKLAEIANSQRVETTAG